ncbi:MAG: ABC transporter permease [Bacteroidia bacterium]|nr:ABC transporter permease [Bacteroidia bacterium]MCZ2247226.1 ABC transporter permease [Bacteroidia bacterium]
MNIERFIAFRLIKGSSKNKKQLSTPLYRISVLAIALSVAVMIIAIAVLDGFQYQITTKVIGFGSHIQLSKYDNNNSFEAQPITVTPQYLNQVEQLPNISKITPYGIKAGIIKTDNEMEGVILKGVSSGFDPTFFKNHLVEGTVFRLNNINRNDSILVSKKIADKLNIHTGNKVVVYFIQNPARVRKFTVSGIYNTGLEDFDNRFLLCDVKHIQKLNNWDSTQFAGIEISIFDFNKLENTTNEINEIIPTDWVASSIKEQFPQLFDWMKLQDINVQVIIILMTLVAIVNMVSALIILILENTQLIGMLKALGMNNNQLRKIFLYQAGNIIGKGLLYGNIFALTLCFLQYHFHWIKLDEASYYIAYIPIRIKWWYILIINLSTFFICIIALLIPSRLISRISPLRAIRFN